MLTDDGLSARGASYHWRYARTGDTLSIRDDLDRLVVEGPLQPVVTTAGSGAQACSTGRLAGIEIEGATAVFRYEHVNGDSDITLTLAFDSRAVWQEAVRYRTPSAADIVSLPGQRSFGPTTRARSV